MPLIKGLQIFALCGIFCASANAIGGIKDTATAIITSPPSYSILLRIKEAHRTMLQLDKYTEKLLMLSVDALVSGMATPEAQAQFQIEKYKIEKSLNKLQFNLSVFGRKEVIIDIFNNTETKHYKFFLPVLSDEALNLQEADIRSKQKAQNVLMLIHTLSNKIQNALPADVSDESLNKFLISEDMKSNPDNWEIIFTHSEDSFALTQTLVNLRSEMLYKLESIETLAQIASKGKHSEKELEQLDSEFGKRSRDISEPILFDDYLLKTKIPLYHDISLMYNMKEEYFFPKVDLGVFGLDAANLSGDVSVVFLQLRDLYNWIYLWIGNNTIAFKDLDQSNSNSLEGLSSLNLTTEQKAFILKKIKTVH